VNFKGRAAMSTKKELCARRVESGGKDRASAAGEQKLCKGKKLGTAEEAVHLLCKETETINKKSSRRRGEEFS